MSTNYPALAAGHADLPPWQQELQRIARAHGVTLEEMKGTCRQRHLVRARWDAFAMLRARGWSLPSIGQLFNRDHTTVMYALERRERCLAEEGAMQ